MHKHRKPGIIIADWVKIKKGVAFWAQKGNALRPSKHITGIKILSSNFRTNTRLDTDSWKGHAIGTFGLCVMLFNTLESTPFDKSAHMAVTMIIDLEPDKGGGYYIIKTGDKFGAIEFHQVQ